MRGSDGRRRGFRIRRLRQARAFQRRYWRGWRTGSIASGAWRSPVARLLWEQEVAGSNPVAPSMPADDNRCVALTAQRLTFE